MTPSMQYVSEGTPYSSNISSDVTALSVQWLKTRIQTRLTRSRVQRTTQALSHKHWVVNCWCVDAHLYECIIQSILLHLEAIVIFSCMRTRGLCSPTRQSSTIRLLPKGFLPDLLLHFQNQLPRQTIKAVYSSSFLCTWPPHLGQ